MNPIARMLGTVGLVAVLATPVWAAGKKTHFTSVGYIQQGPLGGKLFTDGTKLYSLDLTFSYNDVATDPRVSGKSTLTTSLAYDLPVAPSTLPSPGPLWGTYHLENNGGAWDGYYTGTRTAFSDSTGDHLLTRNVTTAVGSGAYQGLVAYWVVTLVDAHLVINPWYGNGYIIEAKGGPSERPMIWASVGRESVELHPVIILPPTDPLVYGLVGTWDILREIGQGSHLGRITNDGLGLLDLATGSVSGSGTTISANGDRLFWVATGTSLGPSGPVQLTLHWAGGTGQFEAAVGAIDGRLRADTESTTGMTSLNSFCFIARGNIRY